MSFEAHWSITASLCLLVSFLLATPGRAETRIAPVKTIVRSGPVKIVDRGRFYEIFLDYRGGVSAREMGRNLGKAIPAAIPGYEAAVDAYLKFLLDRVSQAGIGSDIIFRRVTEQLKPRIRPEIAQEIEGMADGISAGTTDTIGDSKLSRNEVYLLNMIPDVFRVTQCSALAVYGSRSATNRTISCRNLDWTLDPAGNITRLTAVTHVIRPGRSLCLVGWAGMSGVATAVNQHGVLAAILDSPISSVPYQDSAHDSYFLDLRTALEKARTLHDVAAVMQNPQALYAFNHLVFLADRRTSRILEDNLSGPGTEHRRALRSDRSPLNPGISWGFPEAVGAVNAFMLRGNSDNFTGDAHNLGRWQLLTRGVAAAGPRLNANDLRDIMSSYHGTTPTRVGDLYNTGTVHMVLYGAGDPYLKVFFRPRTGELPPNPRFDVVDLRF